MQGTQYDYLRLEHPSSSDLIVVLQNGMTTAGTLDTDNLSTTALTVTESVGTSTPNIDGTSGNGQCGKTNGDPNILLGVLEGEQTPTCM